MKYIQHLHQDQQQQYLLFALFNHLRISTYHREVRKGRKREKVVLVAGIRAVHWQGIPPHLAQRRVIDKNQVPQRAITPEFQN